MDKLEKDMTHIYAHEIKLEKGISQRLQKEPESPPQVTWQGPQHKAIKGEAIKCRDACETKKKELEGQQDESHEQWYSKEHSHHGTCHSNRATGHANINTIAMRWETMNRSTPVPQGEKETIIDQHQCHRARINKANNKSPPGLQGKNNKGNASTPGPRIRKLVSSIQK